ncbi:MAG: hypothetical protein ABL929_07185 [Ferruginibacter sp.]|nr:hypothetical protein [Ferruginibacter sp.]
MKQKNYKANLFATILFFTIPIVSFCQSDSTTTEKTEEEKPTLSLNVSYHANTNNSMYLLVDTKAKIDGKFTPIKAIKVNLYLDENTDSTIIGKFITDKNGQAKAILPISLQHKWKSKATHTFLAISEATKNFEETTTETIITKSKIEIDTTNDGETKTVTAKVLTFNGTNWVAKPEVELKIGIVRAGGGILSVGEEETFTTDETGVATATFNKDSLPGDAKGYLTLIAKIDQHDEIGNITQEKIIPWGKPSKIDNSFFDKRSLWSTRFRTPIWLLFMAYSIIIGVWGTIIYLIMQIIKIKKLGKINTNTF